MWGPTSKADERYYHRRKMEQEQREARLMEAATKMPENIETMMRVKREEISLEEARVIIANVRDQGHSSTKENL